MSLGILSSGSFNDTLNRRPVKPPTVNGDSSGSQVASLQNGGLTKINDIKMPSWMSTDPNQNLGELIQSYAGVGAAFDPSGQVQTRNDAIGYNTSQGGQAANNAATEYSARAAQSGASQLGAGVVKAQAMLPVMQQNAALKTDAADVAAKSHQQAAGLASQIASTIGQLRTSYLNSLTGYATDQQRLQQQQGQFNANFGLDQQKFNYQRQQDQQARADEQSRQQLALQLGQQQSQGGVTSLQPKAMNGNFTRWNPGASSYSGYGPNAYDTQMANQQLRGML